MKTIGILLVTLLCVVPVEAVVVTCVNEGGNVVRLDYSAADEQVLPVAFALDVTVDGGAAIMSVYDYKVGDSTASSRGFGVFPSSMQVDAKGLVGNWGRPDMNPSEASGVQPGVGSAGVTIGMASRYSGQANAPLATGMLCRIRVDMRGAATVNVRVAQNVAGGGVVLENAAPAKFTGVGCTLGSATTPPPPPPPASITYPSTSSTGSYTVSWAASTGATSYQLERSANGGGTWVSAYSGSALSHAETVPNGSYRYRVRATNNGGSSLWRTSSVSCVVSISAPPTPPQAPASITYPATSSTGTYTVSWVASTGAASYQLERSANAGSTWTSVYSGTALSYAETVANGAYQYRVRATNSAGSSAWRTGSGSCVVSISAGAATVGNTTVFSQFSTTTNRRAAPYTSPQAGQLQSVSIYHRGGAGRMILGVYADSSGRPGARLGVTNTVTANGSGGWQTVALPSPVSVVSGQRIWLAWVFERNPGVPFAGGTPGRAQSSAGWSGGMPTTFGSADIANYIYSIYATYGTGSAGYTLTTSATNGTITRTPNKTSYTPGETVTLQATPNTGYTFAGWSGDLTGTTNPASLVMSAGKSVTANFVPGSGAATRTVGNTAVFSDVSTTANRRAAPYTMSEAGQLQSVSIYHQGGSGQMILGVYADNSGRPGTRLGVTNATTINSSRGWQTVSLQSPVSVNSGQRVWLAWVFQSNPGVRYRSGTPGRAQSGALWSGGMPSTFGTSDLASYIYSIYATYDPDDEEDDD